MRRNMNNIFTYSSRNNYYQVMRKGYSARSSYRSRSYCSTYYILN